MNPNEKIPTIESTPDAVSCARDMGRIATHRIAKDLFPIARQIEKDSFPPEFKWIRDGGLKGFLRREAGAKKFSFLIGDNEKGGQPVGYCAASYGVTADGVTDRTSVYVSAFAIAPEHQGTGMGMLGLLELLRRVEQKGGIDVVEFLLRGATSYPAIMNNVESLQQLGWRVTDMTPDPADYHGPGGKPEPIVVGSEIVHHVVLDKVNN